MKKVISGMVMVWVMVSCHTAREQGILVCDRVATFSNAVCKPGTFPLDAVKKPAREYRESVVLLRILTEL